VSLLARRMVISRVSLCDSVSCVRVNKAPPVSMGTARSRQDSRIADGHWFPYTDRLVGILLHLAMIPCLSVQIRTA
jgi:hypothetical protein